MLSGMVHNVGLPKSSMHAAMSLSPPVARQPLHTRTIVCDGFRREDGLYDIEARMVDTKAYDYTEAYRGPRPAGSHVHEMWVRLTLGDDMVVRAIEVSMPAAPYPTCQSAKPNFSALVGAAIGSGWRQAVQTAVGQTRGCTHVRELLFPMATVAFQTIGGWTPDGETRRPDRVQLGGRPFFIDGCIAWAADGDVVAQLHPQYSTGKRSTSDQ